MQHSTITPLALILLLAGGPAAGDATASAATPAGLSLPAECATVSVAALHPRAGVRPGFEATQFSVRLPNSTAEDTAPLQAASLTVTTEDAATTQAELERAASASAAAFLISLTGEGRSSCPTTQLEDAGKPVVGGLERGGAYHATWKNLILHGGAGTVAINRMQLSLRAASAPAGAVANAERPVQVVFSLDGITGKLTPATLLPDHISIAVSLPAASLPTLLAATGGGAPDAQIPVTVDNITILRGRTSVHGQGNAVASATPMQSSTTLHVVARNYGDVVEAAATQGLNRLHTELFLSQMMGKLDPDKSLTWDIVFGDGLLAVNNVPIPLR